MEKIRTALGCMALLVSLTITQTAMAKDRTFQAPMAQDAATGGIAFTSGGVIAVAVMAIEVKGRVAICGFWTEHKKISGLAKGISMIREGLTSASVQWKNRPLIKGLTFMPQVSTKEFGAGSPATCKLTQRKWNPAMTNEGLSIAVVPKRVVF